KLGTIESLHGQILQETDAGAVVDNERVYQGGSGAKYEDISSQTYKTSIARIRAATEPLNPNIIYKTMDFGVPGEWQVDESDTTSADNTGTVLVAADGTRVKRLFSGTVDARWFGVKGNGIDNDAPIIQSVLDFVASIGGGDVLIPPGTYKLNEKIQITGSRVRVFGISAKIIPGVQFGPNDDIITITGSDCSFEGDIEIDGLNLIQKGLQISGPNSTVRGITIQNVYG